MTLRRRHFEEASLSRLLSEQTKAELHFQNDIYTKVRYGPRLLDTESYASLIACIEA